LTDVSEELAASIIRVMIHHCDNLTSRLVIISGVCADFLITLMMEALSSMLHGATFQKLSN
jgi:hypothetical protein